MPCLRVNSSLAMSIPGQCSSEKLLDPRVAEYSVMEPTKRADPFTKLYSETWSLNRQRSDNCKKVQHRPDKQ